MIALALIVAISISWVSVAALASQGDTDIATPADSGASRGKVLLVVIDRISMSDILERQPANIMSLIEEGAVSLMNARVKHDNYGEGGYLVIGAGGRAIGGPNQGLAFNSDERLEKAGGGYMPAGDIYRSRTGRKAPGGSVVNVSIEEMKRRSESYLATSSPGLLGESLAESGRDVGVLGNADSLAPSASAPLDPLEMTPEAPTPDEPTVYATALFLHREIASIAMDSGGVVPRGDVSQDLAAEYGDRTGIRTDFEGLVERSAELLPRLDLLVVDMGQTTRADLQSAFYSDRALEEYRDASLSMCDRALGDLLELVDPSHDMVIVCVPTPSSDMRKNGELLTPLVISAPGYEPGTRLQSDTTRRAGLVSNFDIAPTVLEFLGVEVPAEMSGRALRGSNDRSDLDGLLALDEKAVSTHNSRKAMVRLYVTWSLVVLALFLLAALVRPDLVRDHRYFWPLLLLTVLAGPLVYLLLPLFGRQFLYKTMPLAAGGSLLVSVFALTLRPRKDEPPGVNPLARPLIFVSGLTLLLILLDTLLGSPLMTFSAFGSEVVLGDRYYGMGNLYMGVAIGAALLFSCLSLDLFRPVLDRPFKRYALAAGVFAATALFLGYPRLGANVGGLITAVAAFSVALLKLEGKRIGWKKIALLIAVLVICVGGLLLADAIVPGSASHAGRSVSALRQDGFGATVSQIGRKLSSNWSLAFASNWRLVLLGSVLGVLLLNWRYRLFKKISRRSPSMNACFLGMAVGMVVALLFNDSGIEPAAAISVFLFVGSFILLLPLAFHDEAEGLEH